MKRLLILLFTLWLSACTSTPPTLPSYEGAPRVPINQAVTLKSATAS